MTPRFRAALIKVHTAIAAFSLPVGIMFLITGGLYTAGYEGETGKEVFRIHLSAPVEFSEDSLLELVKHELDKRGIEYPAGKSGYSEKKGRKELKWSGLNKRLRLAFTADPHVAMLTVKTPDWFQRFMHLHKADGKVPFKAYALVWATLLLALFITGIAMAWQVKKLRILVISSALLGGLTFLSLVFHSIWYA